MAAQLFARAVKHHPKIALGDVEPLADLTVRTFFDFVELEHLRHTGRQFAEGRFEVGAEFR